MRMQCCAIVMFILVILVVPAAGKTIVIQGDLQIAGEVIQESENEIIIKTNDTKIAIPRDRLEALGYRIVQEQETPALPSPTPTPEAPSIPEMELSPEARGVLEGVVQSPLGIVPSAKPAAVSLEPLASLSEDMESRAPEPSLPTGALPPGVGTTVGGLKPLSAVFGSAAGPSTPAAAEMPVSPSPLLAAVPAPQTPAPAPSSEEVAPEFRGLWITRFEWPSRDAQKCLKTIKTIFETLKRNHFNAALFQVRGQADVLYRSKLEPWSPLIGGADPGFDPLKVAIEEAHSRGIELHAYVNLMPVWGGRTPPPRTEPLHAFWGYCQPGSNPNWACHDSAGKPMKQEEYVYFSPGIPAVHDYLRRVVVDLVTRYDVDGIHFDRIRYPGSQYSKDPISVARFEGPGNPDNLSWADWQRDQLTRMLNNIYGAIQATKPRVNVSCAAWGIYRKDRLDGYERFSSGYHDYYQDTHRWIEQGVMDALMPMIYWNIPEPKPNFDTLTEDFVKHAAGRHIYAGMKTYEDFKETVAEVLFSRQIGAQGNVTFSYGGIDRKNQWVDFYRDVYHEAAPIPVMPWKENPQTGTIVGTLMNPSGNDPVEDAVLQLSGRTEKWLSSNDGFFAMLNVRPGAGLQITAEKQGVGVAEPVTVSVAPGQVIRVEIQLKRPE